MLAARRRYDQIRALIIDRGKCRHGRGGKCQTRGQETEYNNSKCDELKTHESDSKQREDLQLELCWRRQIKKQNLSTLIISTVNG